MKRVFFFFLLFLPHVVSSQELYNGLYYVLNSESHTASVVKNRNVNYVGDIQIPSIITIANVDYTVTSIESGAFKYCRELTSVTIPNSVTSIGSYAFDNCEFLNSVIIPNSVTSIDFGAFRWCYRLTTITIPDGVPSIKDGTFAWCANLASINIPSSVTSIGREAFQECSKLTSVIIPNSVTLIGFGAFKNCSNLETVTISKNVKYFYNNFFSGCNNLKEVHVHKNELEKIVASKAFGNTVKVIADLDDENDLLAHKKILDISDIPNLQFVPNSLQFIDNNGENAIRGGQTSVIKIQVTNTGKGAARSCVAKVSGKGSAQDITFKDVKIKIINPSETSTIEIPVTAGLNVKDGELELAIQVDEPNGFGTDPQYMTIKTRSFEEPLVKITDYSLTGVVGNTLKKKIPFDLQLMLQNIKYGNAEDVEVNIDIPQNVILVDGERNHKYNSLNGGETKSIVYSLIVNNNYYGDDIPINVHLSEKYSKYSEDRTIVLKLDQALASSKINIEEKTKDKNEIQIAHLGSDVDKNIPITSVKNDKTFAVVIANENYQMVDGVPFAKNDGTMFKAYLQQTLGVPESNIRIATDATLNSMKFNINWLRDVIEAHNGEAKAILYYAGHGVPNEKDNTAYLLPIDGYVSDTSTGYSLEKLYQLLGELPAKSVTFFLDACFSGAKRDGKMLASARGVAIKAKKSIPQGKLIVISAAQGDETAYPFNEQQHGLFTYYLLKKLQSSQGEASLGELSEYVIQEVKKQSIITNNKIQTPSINVAASLQDSWKDIKMK